MCEKVRKGAYVMTFHAEDEMNADNFTVFDVENGILTGLIVERQRDVDTGESKYVIEGQSLGYRGVGIIAKLSPTDKLVIITVYDTEV